MLSRNAPDAGLLAAKLFNIERRSMLDVHPPEHGINGLRDFLIHLLTITIGLLIALGLEASVEAMQHRSERREWETTLRQELAQNRATLIAIEKESERELDRFARSLQFLEELRAGKKGDARVLAVDFNVEPLQSAGWHTASATGALSYMDYGEVQRFSEAYQGQQLFEDTVARAFGHFALWATYIRRGQDLGAMKPQDVEGAIGSLRQVMADTKTMSDLTRGTLLMYDAALQHSSRASTRSGQEN